MRGSETLHRNQVAGVALTLGAIPIPNPGFRSTNWMTPENAGFYQLGRRKFELSIGDFLYKPIIGITVHGEHEQESGAVFTLNELEDRLRSFAAA